MSAYTDTDMQRLMDAIGIGPKTASAILDAVAPAIVARARAEALNEVADHWEQSRAVAPWAIYELRSRAIDTERATP